jgi:hypothetical protein
MNVRCEFSSRENAWCALDYYGAKYNKSAYGGEVRLLTFTDDLPLQEYDFT